MNEKTRTYIRKVNALIEELEKKGLSVYQNKVYTRPAVSYKDFAEEIGYIDRNGNLILY